LQEDVEVLEQNTTVLAIEDDPEISGILQVRLASEGYDVHLARCGSSGVKAFYEHRPDLVLLDVGLPEYDGFEVLNRIRELSDVPVIFISARGGEEDRVRGLRGGGDDYIVKPFGGRELVARIEAVMLRSSAGTSGESNIYADDRVRINLDSHEVNVDGLEIQLTAYEFRLLKALVSHPNQVLSQNQLLDLVWGTDAMEAALSSVRLYVGYLRSKVEKDRSLPSLIETVRGFGYRYRPAKTS
jgi:DNA-binding response OmpR family regulator